MSATFSAIRSSASHSVLQSADRTVHLAGRRESRLVVLSYRHSVTMTESANASVISVMVIVPDADAAVDWYKTALGAVELWNLGGVAGLEIHGAPFFLHEVNAGNPGETSPDRAGVTSTRIEVFVDDPDSFIQRAVAAGATPGSSIEDHAVPWGTHRQGGFMDPFGHKWSVGDNSPLHAHLG